MNVKHALTQVRAVSMDSTVRPANEYRWPMTFSRVRQRLPLSFSAMASSVGAFTGSCKIRSCRYLGLGKRYVPVLQLCDSGSPNRKPRGIIASERERHLEVNRSFIFVETAPHRQTGSNNILARHGRIQTIVISGTPLCGSGARLLFTLQA